MKKFLSIISLITITSSQLYAATFQFSKLSTDEQAALKARSSDVRIQYSELTDDIIIEDSLEQELRDSGVLQTENSLMQQVCGSGGNGK